MPILLEGKPVAEAVQRELAAEVAALKRDRGVTPGLAVVLIGQDPASKVYVTRKRRTATPETAAPPPRSASTRPSISSPTASRRPSSSR